MNLAITINLDFLPFPRAKSRSQKGEGGVRQPLSGHFLRMKRTDFLRMLSGHHRAYVAAKRPAQLELRRDWESLLSTKTKRRCVSIIHA